MKAKTIADPVEAKKESARVRRKASPLEPFPRAQPRKEGNIVETQPVDLLSALKIALAAIETALEADAPAPRTQIEWEAEQLPTIRRAITHAQNNQSALILSLRHACNLLDEAHDCHVWDGGTDDPDHPKGTCTFCEAPAQARALIQRIETLQTACEWLRKQGILKGDEQAVKHGK